MPLIYNKALNLTDVEIRYAMANSRSNREAARFIGCNIDTYKKYAKRYIDPETGKNLWDLHKNQAGKNIGKLTTNSFKKADIFDILDGKHPTYNRKRLTQRIIDECILPQECSMCGFSERRLTDNSLPLVLVWKDGNFNNHSRENLEFLCYNCLYLYHNERFNVRWSVKREDYVQIK